MSFESALGVRHAETLTVTEATTVPALASSFPGLEEMPPVFATAYMIGFIEWTCVRHLGAYLEPGQQSVGVHVDVSHVAATPVGMQVTAAVELVAVEGRKLRFKVQCHDEAGLIGEGLHERAVIDGARFREKLAAKSRPA